MLLFVSFNVSAQLGISFAITLAGLLILLGLQLKILGPNGSINIPFTSPIVEFMQNSYIPRTAAYVLAGVVAGAYLFSQVRRRQRRIKHDLSSASVLSIGLKIAAALVVLEFADLVPEQGPRY